MTALVASARERGLATMTGYVLAVNAPMLRLARKMGFSVGADPDDPSVRLCTLGLAQGGRAAHDDRG